MYDIDKEALYSFNIPFPCISGVYLGYRIDKTVEEDIIEIKDRFKSKNINISVYKAKLSMIVLISDLTKLIKNNTAGTSHPGGIFLSSPNPPECSRPYRDILI